MNTFFKTIEYKMLTNKGLVQQITDPSDVKSCVADFIFLCHYHIWYS